jgi:multiple sugar transport system permease protein
MKKKMSKEALAAILFLAPSFLGFLVFFLFPVLFSLILSFAKWDMSSGLSNIKFVGLKNFKVIFKDIWFTDSMKNSIVFTVATVVIGVSIALILAVILTRAAYFKQTLKAMMFLPYISSTVAIAIVWMIVLQPKYGPVNQFLLSIGVSKPPNWLADMKWAMPALIAMYIWQNLGYNMVVYIAGLSSVPTDLYEAAEIDGAGAFSKFRFITIPMVSPTTFFLVIMGIINSFKVFDQVNVLTQGDPGTSTTVLALYIYREAFKFYDMGSASSAAWIMFVIIFIVTIIQWIGQRKWVTYE